MQPLISWPVVSIWSTLDGEAWASSFGSQPSKATHIHTQRRGHAFALDARSKWDLSSLRATEMPDSCCH